MATLKSHLPDAESIDDVFEIKASLSLKAVMNYRAPSDGKRYIIGLAGTLTSLELTTEEARNLWQGLQNLMRK